MIRDTRFDPQAMEKQHVSPTIIMSTYIHVETLVKNRLVQIIFC